MKSTSDKQMTLPIECSECHCGTILNCACDWKMKAFSIGLPFIEIKEDLKEENIIEN